MSKHTTTRWAIAYNWGRTGGLYTGQSLTRKDAIKDHVDCMGVDLGAERSRAPQDDAERALAWKQAKARGDRAVKVQIAWEDEE